MTTATAPHLHASHKNFVRLFEIAVYRAQRAVGKEVFAFQPMVIRKALVGTEILSILNEQDEDISDTRVRTLALKLDSMLGDWDGKL